MTLRDVYNMMHNGNFSSQREASMRLKRLAGMVGIFVPTLHDEYRHDTDWMTEVTPDQCTQILKLDFAERQVVAIADGMKAMGQIRVEVPSNINVWSHTKGMSAMQSAAEGLVDAAKLIASRA